MYILWLSFGIMWVMWAHKNEKHERPWVRVRKTVLFLLPRNEPGEQPGLPGVQVDAKKRISEPEVKRIQINK